MKRKFIKIDRDLTEKEIENIQRFYNITVLDENEYIGDDPRIILNICRGSFFLGSENMDYLITEKRYKILKSSGLTKKYIHHIKSEYIINDNNDFLEFIDANNEIILRTLVENNMVWVFNYLYIKVNEMGKKIKVIDNLKRRFVHLDIINNQIRKYNEFADEVKRDLANI